jgi:parallel beta-helix repeat protein
MALRRLGPVAAAVTALALVAALPLLSSSSDHEPTVRERPEAGLTGRVGPRAEPCRGVVLEPSDDVQAAIDARQPGTTFCLAPGTHRVRRPLVPREGDALVGRQGAVISGARVLTGWRRVGGAWSTTGFLTGEPRNRERCMRSAPTCTDTQGVFMDGRRLRPVRSRSAITLGGVHTDYETNTITVGDDPRGRLLEQAVAPALVQSTADDITVANLVLEHAANPAQVGAVESRQVNPYRPVAGAGWQVSNNEVRGNHGVGIGVGGDSTVTGNDIHHQGQLGLGVWGTGSRVTNNRIWRNGVAGYSPEWEAGGAKLWLTRNLTISHNDVRGNMGPGLWADGGNIDLRYESNRVTDNWRAGIQHEISYDATVRHNYIEGNGRRPRGWAWDGGIQIQSSGGTGLIEVAHNVVRNNANGIVLIDSGDRDHENPKPGGPHVVENVWVHDNHITMVGRQLTGAVEDRGDPDIYRSNNRFDANTYYLDSLSAAHFAWRGESLSWSGWRGLGEGNDLAGQAVSIDSHTTSEMRSPPSGTGSASFHSQDTPSAVQDDH